MINKILISELFKQGHSLSKIGEIIGHSEPYICRVCKELGLHRENITRKVSDQELLQHRNMSSYDIAKKFNVDNSNICKRLKKLGIQRDLKKISKIGADKHRKYFPNLAHFNPLDRIGSYYLGLFWADGSVYSNGNHPDTFSIGLHVRDLDILRQLAHDLDLPQDIVKISTRIRKIKKYNYNSSICRIKLQYPIFINLLCNLGMKPGPKYKRHVPHTPFFFDFLRGFLDGDGSISTKYKNKQHSMLIQFAITYKSFGEEL